mmetsp:Transcript_11356/g.15727  ORF Transcript_11356/g.15727 Transcript_11356/m.15727 type:complete len:149 (+) Transcript_11356:118-564(+)
MELETAKREYFEEFRKRVALKKEVAQQCPHVCFHCPQPGHKQISKHITPQIEKAKIELKTQDGAAQKLISHIVPPATDELACTVPKQKERRGKFITATIYHLVPKATTTLLRFGFLCVFLRGVHFPHSSPRFMMKQPAQLRELQVRII